MLVLILGRLGRQARQFHALRLAVGAFDHILPCGRLQEWQLVVIKLVTGVVAPADPAMSSSSDDAISIASWKEAIGET